MRTMIETASATGERVMAGLLDVHYHVAGAGDPVIFVHGSGPGTTAWSTFGPSFRVLAGRFRVLAPDVPGWGESAAVEFDARVQVGALLDFMDAVGVERATFVGHSLGGARALDLAAAHPDRVSRLVLLAAPAPGVDVFTSPPSEGGRAVVQAYLDPTPERMASVLAVAFHDQSFATPELAERTSESALAHPEHCANFLSGIAKIRTLFAAEDPAAAIAQIGVPTLVIHGRDDRVVGYEAALRLVSTIADSRLLLLNRCGHSPHVEHAREVHDAIASFATVTSTPGDP